MKTRIYIDGQYGTTGLQIYDRIGQRDDLELLRIAEDKRHDENERRRLLNANPHVRVIDASTAHRVSEGWVYGFPELSAQQRREIAEGSRIANPGCHATGFISVTAPLVRMGILPEDYPVSCYSLTGYSGGGKKMIAEYEAPDKPEALYAPGIYGLNLRHKHVPEMQKMTGLIYPPVFLPVVDDYYKGMATTILLQNRLLTPSAETICERLQEYYKGERFVRVAPFGQQPARLHANMLAGTNELRIYVCGHEEQTSVTAVFDNIMLGLDESTGLV